MSFPRVKMVTKILEKWEGLTMVWSWKVVQFLDSLSERGKRRWISRVSRVYKFDYDLKDTPKLIDVSFLKFGLGLGFLHFSFQKWHFTELFHYLCMDLNYRMWVNWLKTWNSKNSNRIKKKKLKSPSLRHCQLLKERIANAKISSQKGESLIHFSLEKTQ